MNRYYSLMKNALQINCSGQAKPDTFVSMNEEIVSNMSKYYEYRTTVTIGDTNVMQNMYFLNFFKLQGIVRELWVKDCVENGLVDLANGLMLITKNAECEFKKDFFLYDEILVKFSISKIEKTNCQIRFQFINYKNNDIHAEGTQRIVFADSAHKIVPIPDNWKAAISQYLYPND